jgi:hypothetical protein
MTLPRIRPGLELIDDAGDETVIQRVDRSTGVVSFERNDGSTYSMTLSALCNGLRDESFSLIEDEDEEAEEDEDDEEEDDEEGDELY